MPLALIVLFLVGSTALSHAQPILEADQRKSFYYLRRLTTEIFEMERCLTAAQITVEDDAKALDTLYQRRITEFFAEIDSYITKYTDTRLPTESADEFKFRVFRGALFTGEKEARRPSNAICLSFARGQVP